MILYSDANETHNHKKDSALRLALEERGLELEIDQLL